MEPKTIDKLEALRRIERVDYHKQPDEEQVSLYAALLQTPVRVKGVYFGFPHVHEPVRKAGE